MKKVEILIKNKLINIDFKGLLKLKNEYSTLLNKNQFPLPPVNHSHIAMIYYLKRKDELNPLIIGPYKNITPFEAANRIASDLVIINGLIQLIGSKEPLSSIITVRLGAKHLKGKGDFTINEFEGEAFNVAPTFLSTKLYQTRLKWRDNNRLKYILINADAFNGRIPEDKKIVIVNNWDQ